MEKLAPDPARRPRKDLLAPTTSSNANSDPPRRDAERAGHGRPQAVRQVDGHQQQQLAVDDLFTTRYIPPYPVHDLGGPVTEEHHRACSHDGPEQRAHAPHHRPEDDLDGAPEAEDLLGKEVVVIEGEEYAGHGRHRRAEDDRVHLPSEHIDAQRLGRGLILANGAPVVAGPPAEQQGAQTERAHHQHQHGVVVHRRGAPAPRQIDAVPLCHAQDQAPGTAQPIQVIEADARQLGEGDGLQRQLHAGDAQPEGERSEEGARDRADDDGQPDAGPRSILVVRDEPRRGVGAQAHVQGVPQGELAREAHHHVPRLPRVGKVQGQGHHREDVAVDHERQRDRQARARRDQGGAPPGLRGAAGLADHHLRADPMSPRGRTSRSRTSRPKLTMLLAEGASSNPASASDTPITTPPSSAPTMEPRPPRMTITNASSVYTGPRPGVTSMSGTIAQPATAPAAAPTPTLTAYRWPSGRPATRAPRGLSAQARMAFPVSVNRKKAARTAVARTAAPAA